MINLFKKFFVVSMVLAQTMVGTGLYAYAQSTTSAGSVTLETLQKQILQLLAEIQSLKKEVNTLRSEVATKPVIVEEKAQPSVSFKKETGPLPEINRVLRSGYEGEDVRAVQEFLAKDRDLYPEGLVTGYYGQATRNAIMRWQRKYGIIQTGLVGPLTVASFKQFGWNDYDGDQPISCPLYNTLPACTEGQVGFGQDGCAVCQKTSQSQGLVCPALVTVDSCPLGQEKVVSYQSAQCGTYYSCEARRETAPNPIGGQREQIWNSFGLKSWIRSDASQARIDSLKQSCLTIPATANVWLPSAGVFSNEDFGMPDGAKCRSASLCRSGEYFNGVGCALGIAPGSSTTYITSSSTSYNADWKLHIWNFKDNLTESSYILNRTDNDYLNYIASVDSQCRLINKSQLAWRAGAGNDAAINWQNFGIPNCPIATTTTISVPTIASSSTNPYYCSSNQYWNGTSCVTQSTSSTYYQNTRNQVWNSLGMQSSIRSDASQTRIDSLKQACAGVPSASSVWMPGAGDSNSVDFGMPDPNKCSQALLCSSSQYYNGSSCVTPGSSACLAGQTWSGYACITSYTNTSSTYTNACETQYGTGWHTMGSDGYCFNSGMTEYRNSSGVLYQCSSNYVSGCTSTAGTSATSCTSGQYWNGSVCVNTTSTYTSPCETQYGTGWHTMGSDGYCFNSGMTEYRNSSGVLYQCSSNYVSGCTSTANTGSSSCASGQYWNGSACVSSQSTTCSGNQYWNGSACVDSPSSSCSSGQYWNGSSCVSSQPSTTCASGQYWNGSACVNTSSTDCPSGQYWNGSSCVANTSNIPASQMLADIQTAIKALEKSMSEFLRR